jgi:hypothetical protein
MTNPMAWVGEGALSVVRSDDVDRNDIIFGDGGRVQHVYI